MPPDRNPAYLTVHQFDIEDGPPPMDTIDHILDENNMLFGSLAYNRWALVVAPGQAALWLDPTDGAAKLMVTARQSDGTPRTGSIPLS